VALAPLTLRQRQAGGLYPHPHVRGGEWPWQSGASPAGPWTRRERRRRLDAGTGKVRRGSRKKKGGSWMTPPGFFPKGTRTRTKRCPEGGGPLLRAGSLTAENRSQQTSPNRAVS